MGTSLHSIDSLSITQTLIACTTLREFDRRLSEELRTMVHCDLIGFYLYSGSTQSFAPISEALTDPQHPGYLIGQLPAEGTMKEAVVRQGRALLENNMADSSWAEAAILKTAPFTNASVLAAPLLETNPTGHPPTNIVGVMAAVTIGKADAFHEQDRLFFERLGIQLGPVLRNILASEERDALMAINRQVVVGAMTTDQLMPIIRDMLFRIVRQDMTGLVRFVPSPQGPWFDIIYRDGIEIDLAQLRQYPFEHMAPATLVATGKPLLMTGHNHASFPERLYIESVGILSCMLCPLIVRGAAYGFLAIGSKRRNAFSDRDLSFAEQIGFHLSQAITNFMAYEEIRNLKDQLEQENVYLRDEINATVDFSTLVGESSALQQTLKSIEQVAPTDSTVLIMGETGTGKDLVAQAIHQLSPRKEKPFITVNCAALPPALIESELFGHEKGAFTGAAARKIGRFELADGGTIFLDEVGELPLDLQAKFLRVLESQELQRVGGTRTIPLNVRVLAATNVDVAKAVKNGLFRSDLFYRLNVFPIRMPPLRERREDIPMLAKHFVKKYAGRHHRSITRISTGTLNALASYDWPGNVRELEHVIERAVIISRSPTLTIEEMERAEPAADRIILPRTMAEAERSHIIETLRQTHGVLAGKYGAATRLGMKRSTLQHRMKKLGITLSPFRRQ